jgi:hypothetical protein
MTSQEGEEEEEEEEEVDRNGPK